jgi:hypothetical protein
VHTQAQRVSKSTDPHGEETGGGLGSTELGAAALRDDAEDREPDRTENAGRHAGVLLGHDGQNRGGGREHPPAAEPVPQPTRKTHRAMLFSKETHPWFTRGSPR